jgi:hypothetical protein
MQHSDISTSSYFLWQLILWRKDNILQARRAHINTESDIAESILRVFRWYYCNVESSSPPAVRQKEFWGAEEV